MDGLLLSGLRLGLAGGLAGELCLAGDLCLKGGGLHLRGGTLSRLFRTAPGASLFGCGKF
jgi:hypothetical protein